MQNTATVKSKANHPTTTTATTTKEIPFDSENNSSLPTAPSSIRQQHMWCPTKCTCVPIERGKSKTSVTAASTAAVKQQQQHASIWNVINTKIGKKDDNHSQQEVQHFKVDCTGALLVATGGEGGDAIPPPQPPQLQSTITLKHLGGQLFINISSETATAFDQHQQRHRQQLRPSPAPLVSTL